MLDIVVDWLANGLTHATGWQLVVYTLVVTHLTIAGVTIYLHRHQAHRAMDLHAIPSHFFRFWLWLTTGMVTREWVSIHRKHHAKCETHDDPHSPMTRGIGTVFFRGSELYRAEAKVAATLEKFSHGTPSDWIERNLYTRFSASGVALMLVINVALFGVLGLTIWAVQMAWIPIMAAGIINGIGHYWGYRNFEAADASTNISPWGLLIGGEELHNNHHTYPTSAKFSVKPYEFDLGWLYIRLFQMVGWAKVRKVPPQLVLGDVKAVADEATLEAVIANRYEVMANFAKALRAAATVEMNAAKAKGHDLVNLAAAKRWLHRDAEKVPADIQPKLEEARAAHPVLDTMTSMREELRQVWSSTTQTREQLTADLQAWCTKAEVSGIAALHEFATKLRRAKA